MNRLTTHFISQDSAQQRSGRAGRLSAGICYRLWTQQQQQRLTKHSLAEILHSDLSTLVLELANWGVQQPDELQWMDLPPVSAVDQGREILQQLKAINSDGKINSHGRDMLRLATHPRLAHMMLSAVELDQAYHACLIASILTEKDMFLARAEKSADLHERLSILEQYISKATQTNAHVIHKDIDRSQCKRIIQTADDFFKRLKKCSSVFSNIQSGPKGSAKNSIDHQYSGVLLAYAYPDRIAKQRHNHEARYLLTNGKGAVIPQYLQQHLYEFIVIANLDAKQGEANIYLCAEITNIQLNDYFIDIIEHTESLSWNETHQRVEAKQTSSIGKVILKQALASTDDKKAMHECLLQGIKNNGLACLNWSSHALNLKQRVQFIQYYIEGDVNNAQMLRKQFSAITLPDFSDKALIDSLSLWLLPNLNNENSIKQCQKLDIHTLLRNNLNWEQQQLIEKLAPEKITVPSGSAVAIDYTDPAQPILAVRLQEVFGLHDTPVILNGYCQLMMHLLSPARRPMQVTQDLSSFWQSTYHDVKKELRGKYKRHYWPDDPLTAQATSKTKKNMHR